MGDEGCCQSPGTRGCLQPPLQQKPPARVPLLSTAGSILAPVPLIKHLFSALPPPPLLLLHHSASLRHKGTSAFPFPPGAWFIRGHGIIFCLPRGGLWGWGWHQTGGKQGQVQLARDALPPRNLGGKQMISYDCIWDNTSLAVGAARRVPAEPERCYSRINLHYSKIGRASCRERV